MNEPVITIADALWIYLATFVVLFGEIITGQLKDCTKRDFGLTLLCFLSNSAITRPLFGFGAGLLAAWALPAYAGAGSALPLWAAFLVAFVASEFVFYWVHRWSHEGQKKGHRLNWLWKVHRTHHSATEINVTVVQRQNIFWALFTPHIWLTALFVYLGMEAGVALTLIVMYVWNTLTHMHWRMDDKLINTRVGRAIMHVVITPSMHHAHHGYGKNGKMYKNFGLCLAIFDWAFGTLYLPEGKPSRYGVPGEQPHWAEEAFYPLNHLMPKKKAAAAPAEATAP